MRNIAWRFASTRMAALATVGVAAGGAIALTDTSTAGAATNLAPTLAASFTPAEIGQGDSTSVSYVITNPNSSGSIINIDFTDTLPTYTTVDNPPAVANSGCGTPTITADPGGAAIGVVGVTVKAGTPCVISASVAGNAVGTGADTPGPLTYGANNALAPAGSETAGSLVVLAPPTASITTPVKHAKYTYGEKVAASFSCTAPSDANGTTLSGCLGSDDLGNVVSSGDDIDTTDPGVHTLSVQSLDTVGDAANAQVTYTVLPDNAFTINGAKAVGRGGLNLGLKVPGAGTLKVVEKHGKSIVGAKIVKVAGAKNALSVAVAANGTGRKLLAASVPAPKPATKSSKKSAKRAESLKVVVSVTYTPKGGAAKTQTTPVTLTAA